MKTLRTHRRRKGFTMVEIIVVLVILAILIGATTPIMMGFVNDARTKAAVSDARIGLLAAQQVVSECMYSSGALTNTDTETAVDGTAVIATAKFADLLSGEVDEDDFTGVITDGTGKVTGITYDVPDGKTIQIADGMANVIDDIT
jgi:type IV pilus assembly protein PilA